MFIDTTQCHAEDRMLVTRADGVRAIVCERCYAATPKCIIENFDARDFQACVTEASPGAWEYGVPTDVENTRVSK